MALSIVIADADPLARRLIRSVLEEAGVIVLAEACGGIEAVALVLRLAPDVVLLDRPDAVRRIHPHAPVVVLACDEDPDEGRPSARGRRLGLPVEGPRARRAAARGRRRRGGRGGRLAPAH
jgi:chemotaxis response regulator CheB